MCAITCPASPRRGARRICPGSAPIATIGGVFASMFACLWGSVVKAKAYRGHRDALIALVESEAFRDAAKDHIKQYGTAAHVLKLVQQFGAVHTWRV